MKVLGIDPGVRNTGLCVVDGKYKVHSHAWFRSKSDPKSPLGAALDPVLQEVKEWLAVVRPDVVVVEHVEFFGRGKRGILRLAHLAGALGALAAAAGADVYYLPPRAKFKCRKPKGWSDHEHDAWILARLGVDLHAGRAEGPFVRYRPVRVSLPTTTVRGRARG